MKNYQITRKIKIKEIKNNLKAIVKWLAVLVLKISVIHIRKSKEFILLNIIYFLLIRKEIFFKWKPKQLIK
jgi:hypothetical protein